LSKSRAGRIPLPLQRGELGLIAERPTGFKVKVIPNAALPCVPGASRSDPQRTVRAANFIPLALLPSPAGPPPMPAPLPRSPH
jgi:hypothetical protein